MKKRVSIVLCITLFLSIFPTYTRSYGAGESSLVNIPPVIAASQINDSNLKKRLSKFDDYTNVIGYENEDGTETVFIFNDDIKYIDEKGNIKDKEIDIVSADLSKRLSGYAYEIKSSDFEVSFAKELSKDKGVKISYKGNEITFAPKLEQEGKRVSAKLIDSSQEGSLKASSTDAELNNKIQYDSAIDDYTHIRFETTYSGLKEDIILEKCPNTNRFTFITDFGGLTPKAYNKGVQIYNRDNLILEMPPAYVEDSGDSQNSNRRFTLNNEIEISALSNGLYEITIVVDKEFLTNPNTTYPVIIDPSINIVSSSHSDAPVYENYPNSNWGNQIRNCVGNDSTMGTAYFYTKFDLSSLSSIRYDNILSAYYHCRELTGEASNSVIEVLLPFQNWSENSVTWNTKPSCNWEKLGKVNVSYGNSNSFNGNDANPHWYDFYITSAVMAWQQGVPNYGVGFKERIDSNWKAFASKEYSAYLPSLVVTYIDDDNDNEDDEVLEGIGLDSGAQYYIKNKRSDLYLTNNGDFNESNIYQSDYTGNANQKWSIYYQDNGYYKIAPANSDRYIDVYGGSNHPSGNMNGSNIQLYQSNNGDNQLWKIVRNWNGTYRFLSKYSDDYRAMVVEQGSDDSGANVFLYDYSSDYMYNDDWTLEPVYLGYADFFSFTNEGGYGIDTTPSIDTALELSEEIGFIADEWTNCDAGTAHAWMGLDGLWYFTGHGGNSSVYFNSQNGASWEQSFIGAIGENNFSEFYISEFRKNELNTLKLAVFSSCNTGLNSGDSNLTGMVFKRGAHFVISHTIWTSTVWDANWMVSFLSAINDGENIHDAMDIADDFLYSLEPNSSVYGNLNQRHTLGDGSVVLNH